MTTITSTASQTSIIAPPKRAPAALLPSYCNHIATVENIVTSLSKRTIPQKKRLLSPLSPDALMTLNQGVICTSGSHRLACTPLSTRRRISPSILDGPHYIPIPAFQCTIFFSDRRTTRGRNCPQPEPASLRHPAAVIYFLS